MTCDLVLKGGTVVTPTGPVQGDIAIERGHILAVGPGQLLPKPRRYIDVSGKVVMPGLIDPHVHFGSGDERNDDTMREDFKADSKDCLIGGVTTIATTTVPGPRSLLDAYTAALRCAEGNSYCDYKITSVVSTRSHIGEIGGVGARGGVSFKFFTGYVGWQAESLGLEPSGITPDFFFAACKEIQQIGPPAFAAIHAEEPYVREMVVDDLKRRGEPGSLVAWAESTPEWAESVQMFTYGLVAQHVGVPIYFVHISCGTSVDTVQYLRRKGVDVVGETLAYYLSATAEEMDIARVGARGKNQPPIRHEGDRNRLWQGLRDGDISVVGTDSLTISSNFKAGDFWDAPVGMNMQVADALPLLWDQAMGGRELDLVQLTRVLSENAAKRYGLYPRKGTISVGADADLVVVDPELEMTLGVKRYRGKSDYSVWDGKHVKGGPTMTLLHGEVAMADGEIVAETPAGKEASSGVPWLA